MDLNDFEMVMRAIRAASERYPDGFTTDDVWPLLSHVPVERNVIGKAFSHAYNRGVIEGTERFVQSTRPESKGRRVQVWKAARPADLWATA